MTRIRRTRRGVTRLSVLVAVLIGVTALPPVVTARANETTVSADRVRTGWDPAEPNLAPADVGAADFGQLFSTTVDGSVYAQPLVIGDLVVVTTENAKAYGIDKISGAIRWERDFGTPFPASAIGCGDLTPNLGSTSTPVYDPKTATMYLTTKIVTGENPNRPTWFMHAISVADGSERAGFPVTIAGKPDNTAGIPFQPFTAMQRPGLLLLGGVVYAGFASHCDINPYRGYVVGVSTAKHAITAMWSTEAGSGADASSMAGIWQSGGGLVSDGPGRIILATGNGVSPPAAPGSPPPKTLAESVVRLAVGANGKLSAKDFFSPADAPTLDQNDTDLGSGGPAALPSRYFGTAAHPNLLVEVGKDGRVFLLDRDNLGGREQGPHHTDGMLAMSGPYAGVWGHPAVYGGEGGWVYTVENTSYLRALRYGVDGAGVPTLSSAATSAGTFGYTSGSPVVTSDGTTPGSAIVWVESSTGSSGTGGQLRAYAAVPSGSVLQLLWSSPIGIASKFAVPATDSGRVYVGTRDGHVFGFGRPATPALQTSSLEFGDVKVGTRKTLTTVVTATRDVEVTGVSTAAPFTATPPSLPVLLHAGDSLEVPVHFAPASAGDTTAQLSIASDAGAYALDLHGYGTAQGLLAAPPSIDFGTIAVGAGGKTLSVNIANSWTKPEKITATTPPGSPFSVTGLPSIGQVLTPAQSVTVSILYNPATAGTSSDSLVVTSNHGAATIPLTGSALSGHGHLEVTPNPLAFAKVAIGDSKTMAFDISNTGNIPITLTKAKAPAGVFSTSTPVSEGLTLDPDAVIHQKVTFAPTARG
ncbi:MAG TPA: choice-of-anchor D domain-containing protein, partial [Acidimicrobiia bacterium]|nr:choice-of-anchor D domain-containing protein [Acidimicrobiia bacterium]